MPYKDPVKRAAYQRKYNTAYYKAIGFNKSRLDHQKVASARCGLTVEQFQTVVNEAITCALCGKEFVRISRHGLEPVVDHDHSTKTFRGVIHRRCNTAIGMFADSSQLCLQAAEYLIAAERNL